MVWAENDFVVWFGVGHRTPWIDTRRWILVDGSLRFGWFRGGIDRYLGAPTHPKCVGATF